jgi:UPF0755 protein
VSDPRYPPDAEDQYLLDHEEYEPETAGRRNLGILITVLALGVLVVTGAQWLQGKAQDALSADEAAIVTVGTPREFTVPTGASARLIASMLEDEGIVDSANDFETEVQNAGVAERLAAGTYLLATRMLIGDVIDVFLEGPAPVAGFRLIVREGLRINEVLAVLSEQSDHSVYDFELALTSGNVLSPYLAGQPQTLQSWEGLLFPDTYEFRLDATPVEILQLLADTMQIRIESLDWTLAEELGISRYESIVMASIIEGETRVDEDRPQVASVIVNRLDAGMHLQIDAIILYALDARGIGLTLDDLEIESVYNSYTNLGLPPTPIGAPGRTSLAAAAAPMETDFIYYVLTSSDGSHSFTSDYNQFLTWKNQAKSEGLFP